jgi:hypothetical protein
VVLGEADPVQRRVAHRHVGRGHVDARAQHMAALGVQPVAHATQQRQALGRRPIAVRRVAARLGQGAAARAHLFGALRIDVGMAMLDEVLGHRVELLEVVARVVEVAFAVMVLPPGKAQPLHGVEDGIDVLLVFLDRVGVVEAHVAAAAVVLRQAEVQADRLGMANMQVAVGLGRETGADTRRIERAGLVLVAVARPPAPVPVGMGAGGEIAFDLGADEVAGRGRRLLAHRQTPRSSTSKSRVALGGITPPAPRAP